MDRESLLKFLDGKISSYYFDILYVWTMKRKKVFLFFNRKFDMKPTLLSKGYVISAGLDSIIVYNDGKERKC